MYISSNRIDNIIKYLDMYVILNDICNSFTDICKYVFDISHSTRYLKMFSMLTYQEIKF